MLSQVKLIAEPWDIGSGGYQVGNFPPGWNEWNDKYRDSMRAYWKGDGGLIGEFARRFTGSADLYEASGRKPHASINFITAHDGFTLEDLVSYNEKHNEANGEDNRDGAQREPLLELRRRGRRPTMPAIRALRARQKRNLMATLLLSQGVPMLLGGDELGHTQRGNNNAYCQDNEISWLDWELDADRQAFLEFTAALIAMRRRASGIQPPTLPPGRYGHRRRPAGNHLAGPRRARNDRGRVGRTVRALPRALSRRRGHRAARPARAPGDGQQLPAAFQRASRAYPVPAFRAARGESLVDGARHGGATRHSRSSASSRRHAYPLQGRSLALLRETAYR